MRAHSLRQASQQLGHGNAQDPGDQPQVQDGEIPLAALNRADEGPVEIATLGQVGLGPLAGLTMAPNAMSQATKEFLVVEVHRCLTPMMAHRMMRLSSTHGNCV